MFFSRSIRDSTTACSRCGCRSDVFVQEDAASLFHHHHWLRISRPIGHIRDPEFGRMLKLLRWNRLSELDAAVFSGLGFGPSAFAWGMPSRPVRPRLEWWLVEHKCCEGARKSPLSIDRVAATFW